MNIRINVIKNFLHHYKSLFFFLFFSSDFIFANEDIFKPDNDIFNDEEFNTSTEKFDFIKIKNFNFIKKMQIKNTSRIYLGAHLPIPISMGVLGKYIYDNNLNIIEDEAISTNLEEEQKKKYIIYDEITKYNAEHHNSQINDCFKIKDENLLNDYMARYKVNNEDKLAAPIYFTNLLKFATIMGKMNEYNNKNTECEFGLHGLEGENYKNRLQEKINFLTNSKEDIIKLNNLNNDIKFLESCLTNGEINYNDDKDKKEKLDKMGLVEQSFNNKFFSSVLPFIFKEDKKYPDAEEINNEIETKKTKIEEIKKRLDPANVEEYPTYDKDAINLKICHLNNLEKQQKGKELSDYMTYGKIKPFKSLIYYNFNFGASNTLWINKRLGWEIDLSGSFSYFDLKKSVFLTKLDDGAQKLFKGENDVGKGNLEFGLLNGHILNQNILKQESEKKSVDEDGKYKVLDFEIKAKEQEDFITQIVIQTAGNMSDAVKQLYYCEKKAENTRDCATNFFVTNKFILKKQPSGCFNIGCTLKQINVCLKTGITINLNNPNSFLKNYRGHLFNKSHQLVFNVGCIVNINFWNLNLNFDIDEKALQNEGMGNLERYNEVKESYESFLNFNNTKKMVSWLKEDFIQQYKFRPMFEIKYRIDSEVRVSFEVGLRFIFRSALNFDIDKAGMQAYWNNPGTEIPKYDNNTTNQQLQERKTRILNNINNFGIKWFYNFDMCLFFSIGFNILK